MHQVLQRLQRDLANPESLLNRANDDRRQELSDLGSGCEQILKIMSTIVSKYNTLAEQKRSPKKMWKRIQFGNGEMHDLADLRSKLSMHTSAIVVSLQMCSLGSQGRMEKQLNSVGGELEGLTGKVDLLVANIASKSSDGTVWTSYEDDDKAFWRELRRGLVKEGYRSSVLHKHKHLIKNYVVELGNRGVFDVEGDILIIDKEDGDMEEEISASKKTSQSLNSDVQEDTVVEDDSEPSGNLEFEPEPWDDSDEENLALEAINGSSQISSGDPRTNSDPASTESVRTLNKSSHRDAEESFTLRLKPVDSEATKEAGILIVEDKNSSLDREKEQSTHATKTKTAEINSDGERNSQDTTTSKLPLFGSIKPEISRPTQESEDGDPSIVSSESRRGKEQFTCKQDPACVRPDYGSPDSVSNKNALNDPCGYIKFTDCLARKFCFPFCLVDTWPGIERLIKEAFEQVDDLVGHVIHGHYSLLCPRGEVILPLAWEDTIQPNWFIKMEMWPGISFSRVDLLDVLTGPFADPITSQADPIDNSLPLQVPPLHIEFTDCVGRKYLFPFRLVESWTGVERLINQAFGCIETLGPMVEHGLYDLFVEAYGLSHEKNDGVCLLPQVWEQLIQPFSAVQMYLWPIPDPKDKALKNSVSWQSPLTPSWPLAKRALPKGVYIPPNEKPSTSCTSGTKSSLLASQQPGRKDSNTTPVSSFVPRADTFHIVKLTDCIGRNLAFPLEMVRTREGMHKLITQALPIKIIDGPLPELVRDGKYSVFWAYNGKNLENNWEGTIVPGVEGTMKMWPNHNLPPTILTCPGPQGPAPPPPPSWPLPRPERERKRRLKGKELEQVILLGPSKMKDPKLPSRASITRFFEGSKKETKEWKRGVLDWMAGATKKETRN